MSAGVRRMSSERAYALWAPHYDQRPNAVLALEERVVEALLPDVGGMSVLDVACGTGRWLAKLISRGGALSLGVDLSSGMLARAAERPGLRGRLAQCDGARTPLPQAAVTLAICAFGLGYMSHLNPFAAEMARILDDGGHFILTDLHPRAQEGGWRRTFRHQGAVIEAASRIRRVSSVCRAFEKIGFELEDRREEGFDEPERALFESAGKDLLFREAQGQVAIYACRFRRVKRRAR